MNTLICRNSEQDDQRVDRRDLMTACISVFRFWLIVSFAPACSSPGTSHEEENEEYASINLIINKRILQFFNQKKTSLAGFYLYFCEYFYA
ncbi:MAG: hypothetical protein GZ094_06775 [Mariniphaga sp.]|nr:hypothetical protein [Mariniphaga sp.]